MALAVWISACGAWAGLPTTVPPSGGTVSADVGGALQGYTDDGVLAVALLISVAAFVWIAWMVLTKLNDARCFFLSPFC